MINDPYLTGSHMNDVVVFSPIFRGDALIGFSATKAHWLDIGAKDPGGRWTRPRSSRRATGSAPTHLYARASRRED